MDRGVDQKVLGLDVSMTNALGVNISERAEHLVGVEFDEENRNGLLHAVVVLHDAVDGLWNEVHDDV